MIRRRPSPPIDSRSFCWLWCKLSESTQRIDGEHESAHAARTAFQISGGFAFDEKLAEFELTFSDPMHQFDAGYGD
jgi:hypothetical protein